MAISYSKEKPLRSVELELGDLMQWRYFSLQGESNHYLNVTNGYLALLQQAVLRLVAHLKHKPLGYTFAAWA
jgi:hypothetical protein